MPKLREIPVARIRECLSYDPTTGLFTWRSGFAQRLRGQPAGHIATCGARQVEVDGQPYLAGRLAFAWMTGRSVFGLIEHIDGGPDSTAWTNLREATLTETLRKRKLNSNSTTGAKGVTNPRPGRFAAEIVRQKKRTWLGTFDTIEAARAAYEAAACS